MKVKIDDLRIIQKELDTRIFKMHDTTREKTRNDRVLALLVELSELANETRCFKYWSLKEPASRDLVFEEFSDVTHFALSLGIDINHDLSSIEFEPTTQILNEQFLDLYHQINVFSKSNTLDDYNLMLKMIFTLAHTLSMDEAHIRSMYLEKNKKNHKRQDDGY